MNPKSAIQKGKELENWIVERLRLTGLDNRAYRQKGSGNGLNKGDIWNDLNLCIEAKNQKNFQIAWFEQAERESMGTQEPIVVWKPPQQPLEASKVLINWDYFEKLLVKSKRSESELKTPDREMKYLLQRLGETSRAIIKKLEV